MARIIQYPAVQGPVELVIVTAPTWFEADPVQVFPRRWAQQPDATSAPVTVPAAVAVPPWFDNITQQVFARRAAQQPDATSAPVFVVIVPTWFDASPPQPFGRGRAQQPDATSAPVTVPLGPPQFAPWLIGASRAETAQVFPRRAPQQPDATSTPVLTPAAVVIPAFFDNITQQVFPRRWAQQPDADAAPVMAPAGLFYTPYYTGETGAPFIWWVDASLSPGIAFRLQAILHTSNASFAAHVRLFDVTANAAVAGSDTTTVATAATTLRSANFAAGMAQALHAYRVEFGGTVGATYTLDGAQLELAVA